MTSPGWVKWKSAKKIHWTNDGVTTICGFEVGGYKHGNFKYTKEPIWHKNYWGWTALDSKGHHYCGDCTRIWAVLNKTPISNDEREALIRALDEQS